MLIGRIGTAFFALFALSLAPVPARGAALELSLDYRGRALSYRNLDLNPGGKRADGFLSERARVGFLVKRISLETVSGVETSMELGLVLQALSVAGSTMPVGGHFAAIASRYPRTDFTPFVENAYLKVFRPAGTATELTVGRQPALLGSGLVVSDDGLGFTGISLKRPLKGWGGQAFYFQPRAGGTSAADRLHLAGAALDLPTDGVLTVSHVIEADHSGVTEAGIAMRSAVRHFPGLRYTVRTDQFAFEGEGVLQRGSATPLAAGASKVAYRGSAGQLLGLWRQEMGRFGAGTARLGVMEASGDDPATAGKNEAFFPTFGHRYDGLERDGWGEFFGASPYDAIGPSTTTANGLPAGVSGLRSVRVGATLPLFHDIRFDVDYYLFRASKAPSSRDLGKELDLRGIYNIKERLFFKASAAFFSSGKALSPKSTSASRFLFEISGKF